MWLTVKDKNSVEIAPGVIDRILDMYPEEKLSDRKVFQDGKAHGFLDFERFRSECEKILVPWQMFLLDKKNLEKQIFHIEKQRLHNVSSKLIAKRKGSGNVTSKRIVDRLIRQQNYTTQSGSFAKNPFCGSLKGRQIKSSARYIESHFDISTVRFRSFSTKESALDYLIERVEAKSVNVSRGVLTNKILPHSAVVPGDVYKNTSGFAIRDEKVPFVFLPSEINPDEVASRQIYTLVYLLTVIGLDQYDYVLNKDFAAKMMFGSKVNKKIHSITSEFLLPSDEISQLQGSNISITKRDELAARYKVSPTALVTTLKVRKIIDQPKYDEILPDAFVPGKRSSSSGARTPKVSTSAKKFCGQQSFAAINTGLQNGTLGNTQAQYLIFGTINKKNFKKYRSELDL